jgi:hypothetical protein
MPRRVGTFHVFRRLKHSISLPVSEEYQQAVIQLKLLLIPGQCMTDYQCGIVFTNLIRLAWHQSTESIPHAQARQTPIVFGCAPAVFLILAKGARRARRASTRRRRAQTRARRVQRAQSRRQAATALSTACVWPATKSSRMIRRPCAPRVRWASTRRRRATLRARRARTIRPPSRQDLPAPVSVTQATKLRRRNAPHVLPANTKQTGA